MVLRGVKQLFTPLFCCVQGGCNLILKRKAYSLFLHPSAEVAQLVRASDS